MSKYVPSLNIWNMTESAIAALPIGQWVYAGKPEDKGIFLGVKPSGSVVVAWYQNAISRASFRAYVNVLRKYAKGA